MRLQEIVEDLEVFCGVVFENSFFFWFFPGEMRFQWWVNFEGNTAKDYNKLRMGVEKIE